MRLMGVQTTSVSIMMTFWSHPLIMLLLSIWTIGRGSAAVAAEIERGTMDLILSRPLARSTEIKAWASNGAARVSSIDPPFVEISARIRSISGASSTSACVNSRSRTVALGVT